MDKTEILKALDRMEDARHSAEEHPERYPQDYIFRLCEAITAKLAGYTSRAEWADDLNSDASTHYHEWMQSHDAE